MELHKALKNIIQTEGREIIKDLRIINILDDFNAFNDIPSLKYILRAIITDGYSTKFLTLNEWNNHAEALVHKFINTTGFVTNYVDIIFQSIAYGLDYKNEIIRRNFNTFKSKPVVSINKHLQFDNIEMDGTLNRFCGKLEELGYKMLKYICGGVIYKGNYYGDICQIIIYEPQNLNKLSHIDVITLGYTEWDTIKNNYLKFKKLLIDLYGDAEEFEFIDNPSYDGSGKEIDYIEDGETYASIFTLPCGIISISIYISIAHKGNKDFKVGAVKISYLDRINSAFPVNFRVD